MAPGKVWVITGASRGLGLEHVRQLMANTQDRVVAACRNPAKAKELQELAQQHKDRLELVPIDIADDKSVKAAAQKVAELHPDGIDVLLNNAGIQEEFLPMLEMSAEEYRRVLNTNLVGPFVTVQHFKPLLEVRPTKKIITVSSILGSVDYVRKATGQEFFAWSSLAYNSSKAATNMQMAMLKHALPGYTCIALHPGWVQSEMGNRGATAAGMKEAPTGIQDSIAGQQRVINSMTTKDSGRYMDFEGNDLAY